MRAAPSYRQQAFRKAARGVAFRRRAAQPAESARLTDIPGVGEKTAAVIVEALNGETPQYLPKLLNDLPEPGTDEGEALRSQLKGDLHSHSDWSDGGDTIAEMAGKARDLGHEYLALTDHSPRLTIAHGLTADRLREQLDVVGALNDTLAPFRFSLASRSTSSKTARSTSTKTCSRRSTSWSPASTRSCAWKATR